MALRGVPSALFASALLLDGSANAATSPVKTDLGQATGVVDNGIEELSALVDPNS